MIKNFCALCLVYSESGIFQFSLSAQATKICIKRIQQGIVSHEVKFFKGYILVRHSAMMYITQSHACAFLLNSPALYKSKSTLCTTNGHATMWAKHLVQM